MAPKKKQIGKYTAQHALALEDRCACYTKCCFDKLQRGNLPSPTFTVPARAHQAALQQEQVHQAVLVPPVELLAEQLVPQHERPQQLRTAMQHQSPATGHMPQQGLQCLPDQQVQLLHYRHRRAGLLQQAVQQLLGPPAALLQAVPQRGRFSAGRAAVPGKQLPPRNHQQLVLV